MLSNPWVKLFATAAVTYFAGNLVAGLIPADKVPLGKTLAGIAGVAGGMYLAKMVIK